MTVQSIRLKSSVSEKIWTWQSFEHLSSVFFYFLWTPVSPTIISHLSVSDTEISFKTFKYSIWSLELLWWTNCRIVWVTRVFLISRVFLSDGFQKFQKICDSICPGPWFLGEAVSSGTSLQRCSLEQPYSCSLMVRNQVLTVLMFLECLILQGCWMYLDCCYI